MDPADAQAIDLELLRSLSLPPISGASTKHERGRVLIVGGSRETPGAVLLAAEAALRAGAGVVQIATASSAAPSLAIALPETRVVPLPEVGREGAITDDRRVAELASGCDAVLVGSGTFDPATTRCLLEAAVAGLDRDATLVVDAAALDVVAAEPELIRSLADRAILMPNVNEAARMCGRTPENVAAQSRIALEALVVQFGTVVALRGSESWVSAPNAPRYCNIAGHELLGVAGSGDVLAGVLVGLAARGFAPLAAALCSVYVHARAGEQLAAGGPAVGRPARELLAEVSGLVEQITIT